MPHDTAHARSLPEQSPVIEARARLDGALARLEAIVHSRVENALRMETDTHAAAMQQAETTIREWEAAYRALGAQHDALQGELAGLRDTAAAQTQQADAAAEWERERKAMLARISALENANHTLETRLANAPAGQEEQIAQWQNASRLLEQQLATLRDENSLLHSEAHQLREQAARLKQANGNALASLDDAISTVESLLNGA